MQKKRSTRSPYICLTLPSNVSPSVGPFGPLGLLGLFGRGKLSLI
jgi:hypothetical protein